MATATPHATVISPQDLLAQMNKYRSYAAILADTNQQDEHRLKVAQEISENFESIVTSGQYQSFLEHAIPRFLKVLQEGDTIFVQENPIQQLRKLLLEIIHRIPTNDHFRIYVSKVLSLMFQLIERENEENVLVCLRIIIELHKQFRPQIQPEIQHFLHMVKQIYKDLPANMNAMFEKPINVTLDAATGQPVVLPLSGTVTVQTEKADGSKETLTVLSKGINSLKVLAELPIIVVLMYQLYKQNVHSAVAEFIPLIMNTIVLTPSAQARASPQFNRELYVDFVAAQIKTLSFLAYIIRIYQESVTTYANQMVKGMLSLLTNCPQEVTHLRKELLIAARHILATDLRNRFVPHIDRLFDEKVLIGTGWTTRETLRPLAYSTLADLVHHVRQHLQLSDLALAVHLFSKNVHDDLLPSSIQTMSCKLLLNLVECIKSDQDGGNGREILMRMLEVFVLKFHTIAKFQLPGIFAKCDKEKEEEKSKPAGGQFNNFSVSDCRSLVKTLVCGVKTITWGAQSCKTPGETSFGPSKQFQPKETAIFSALVRHALCALDIYQINVTPSGQPYIRAQNSQTVRMKEEKDVLEHFAGVFTMMNLLTFKEIFSTTIEFMVERIYHNYALQIVANTFLANPSTSATFATILVDYLLDRLEEIGSANIERSNLYLKLFKLVFGSVSLFAAENEQMLKPHLHKIVNSSMELAQTAKEPYNYFLLMRALFRSIGGGSHDLLYQEFLPLLPHLLQGLNNLQSGLHKQHMKDLFVELCLTVPVRLSSLLPYLPMLMDPLVSALNGSQTLVSQGLRTLELCVDNLQPEFLWDHIQPVRAELMQALWRTLRNPAENIAQVAFRVLGKFGGNNRKMLMDPQKLTPQDTDVAGPCITINFLDCKQPINLPVDKALEVIKGFLVGMMSLEDNKLSLHQLLAHQSFAEREIPPPPSPLYKCPDSMARKAFEQALAGAMMCAVIKDLRASSLPFVANIIRHYTMVALVQQCGPFPLSGGAETNRGMDPLVIVDAVAVCMSHEEKELCKIGEIALAIIIEVTATVLGSKEKACQLPLFEYIVERLCSCCYERAWYAKYGGCVAIRFLLERTSLRWILEHELTFLKALFFVLMDLTGEVSSGALDLAKADLEKLLKMCATPIQPTPGNRALLAAQEKAFREVTLELVREVTSSNNMVRQQAMHSLRVLAKVTDKTITAIMEPHKNVLEDMIPPKKHLLRHQPANAQIGLMEGNTFCTTLQPRLFTIDLNIMEHKVFFTELLNLCEAEDSMLIKLPCYKNMQSLTPLRISALNALAACHYIPQVREKIFTVLFKSLNSSSEELQTAAMKCMKDFLKHQQMDAETIHNAVRPLLMVLGDYRSLTLSVIKRLTNVTTLFPNVFNEKLCDQLMAHLKKWMDVAIIAQKGGQRTDGNVIKVCAAIIHMFHTIPAASIKMIDPLVTLVLKAERALLLEIGSPFRDPLMKFLLRYPAQSVDLFIQEAHLKEPQTNRTFTAMLKREEAKPFRDVIQANPLKLANVALSTGGLRPGSPNYLTQQELQYQAIHIYSILVKHDPAWLSKHPMLMSHLKQIWISDDFQEKHSKEQLSISYWREPKLLVKCLLSCVKQNPGEVELLFQLLRAFTLRFISNFHFLKTFLEEELYKVTSIDQKRTIFLEFVKLFHDQSFPQELKAKALQHILIPMFSTAFQNGQGEKLIGGPPTPESDDETNLISVFINKVIDPENPYGHTDAVRILLLQFSALLVEQASPHIHDAANKRQGNKLRRLMTFAWPCLLPKNCVDPATKYHGHLLLSHIIAKFAIHKRIVLQVFHSLLKAHALEARKVVQQALEILTPAMPARMEDGNAMLTHWTKKIIVEEGHTVAQLVHMLQLLVRHYKVYYPVRHHLIQHMVSSMQRLGFTPSASIEHRRLAVELCEVIVKWEMQRVKDEQEQQTEGEITPLEGVSVPTTSQVKRAMSVESPQDSKRVRHSSQTATPSRNPQVELVSKPIEKIHADNVVNFLVKIACQVNEASTTQGSPGEMLSKRCVFLVKTALKPDLWPNSELRLAWIDKLLMTIDQSGQANFANICTALELLTYLLGTLSPQNILATFKPLQRGIAACMTCGNQKVVRFVQQLLAKLMSIFPTEPSTSSVASQYEELECLYAAVGKVIYEGLTNYEKAANGSPSSLFGTLWILKSACVNNASYIDRLISVFMRTLQKMVREHLTPAAAAGEGTATVSSDLIILSLDLIKTRVAVMSAEMRKNFIQVILTQLIERSPDAKILKAITRIMEEWIKIKGPMAVNATPTLKEKAHLLTKMMHFTEKRFPDDNELNAQFLELVNYIYRDESLRGSELTVKLEPAFLAGLRCVQSHIRAKFVEVFDQSIRRRLYDRLLYMTCSQNWESMGTHFWVKQCTELMLAVSDRSTPVSSHSQLSMLPSITHVINLADSRDKMAFAMAMRVKEEPMDVEGEKQEEDMEIDIELTSDEGKSKDASGREEVSKGDLRHQLSVLTNRHGKFLESLKEVKTTSFLTAVSQLCHYSTQLSHSTWVELFPRLWKVLSERQQQHLAGELGPFLCSGSHVFQKECQPSAIHTFVEGISRCVPPIPIRPCVLKYLGKTHNLWHRSTLMLEQSAFESGFSTQSKNKQANEYYEQEGITPPQQETLDMLSELYSLLREEDMWAGLWQKRCKFPETATAIAYEQQGFFEQAQTTYEGAMTKARQDHNSSSAAPNIIPEYRLWEDHWIRCSKELNQWDLLMEYGSSKAHPNPHLVLESAWRVPNWASMKDALVQVEQSCPKEMAWKVNMYRGYIAICHPEEHHLNLIERLVEMSSSQSIKEWRRLPLIVANIHVPLLQAAQQVIELQEASQIHTGLQPANIGRNSSLHDMKAIVKTWRNRLPLIADDLSHWSDIFMWRHHHYNAIVSAYEGHVQHDPQSSNHSMLGVHASAHSIIHYGKIARKHGLIGTCLDSLSRIHTIPSVPIVDCFQKIRQQVKCYLQMSGVMGRNECMQGLEVIESTNLKYFTKEMTAEFYALKGMFLAQINKSEEANKAFSSAVQMHDTLIKAWALWGDYLENIFTKDRLLHLGVSAITCYLHACRHTNESKCRKYLAKVIWLLTYDDDKGTLAEAVDKYCVGVPHVQWLPW
ncbi:PREDICTED: transformation/transcription domain-associated protein-like [Branchiostoma belcheri]|nr:PREDICTED: transformation/transcription domain-associated protein-like [Branchiostoma belcheri]